VLYVSGEESERQIKMRAMRLGAGDKKSDLPANLLLVTETNLETIFNHVREVAPTMLIVDSIQTMYLSELESAAGSVSQVRECSSQLRELAKSSGISVFVIGHVTKEGTRPLLVEIQGLTSPTQFGNARRTPNGVDFNRLLLIAAVLTRRVGVKLGEQDIFVNVVSGLKVDEPAADLAVAAAIASSWRDVPIRAEAVLIGEVGLAGELRMPGQMQIRLREAAKLGFKSAIVPRAIRKVDDWPKNIEIIQARSLKQALDAAFMERERPKGRKVA